MEPNPFGTINGFVVSWGNISWQINELSWCPMSFPWLRIIYPSCLLTPVMEDSSSSSSLSMTIHWFDFEVNLSGKPGFALQISGFPLNVPTISGKKQDYGWCFKCNILVNGNDHPKISWIRVSKNHSITNQSINIVTIVSSYLRKRIWSWRLQTTWGSPWQRKSTPGFPKGVDSFATVMGMCSL